MNDNQIIKENWMEKICNHALDNFPTIRKPVVKHIPITVWEEVKPSTILDDTGIKYYIRNQGGKTYLVYTKGVK